jgi:hypothetical protein
MMYVDVGMKKMVFVARLVASCAVLWCLVSVLRTH